MRQMTISMLRSHDDTWPGYDAFHRTYSMMVAANAVTYHLVDRAAEPEVAALLEEAAGVAEVDFERARIHYAAVGLSYRSPQLGEDRGLDLADVARSVAEGGANAKGSVLAFLNSGEFMLLFAMFEDAVKGLLREGDGSSTSVSLKVPEVMTRLSEHLRSAGAFDQYRREVVGRTVCRNLDHVERMWRCFAEIRHVFVHSGGRPTSAWLAGFDVVRAGLIERLRAADLATMDVVEVFEQVHPEEGRLLVLSDPLVNVFRGLVVAAMEAAYLGLSSVRSGAAPPA